MGLTSGFYDSLNGDRRYNAQEMSAIFDGIINDGVLATVGDAFKVTAETENRVTVGVGRAWFNSTWVYNDSVLSIVLPENTVYDGTKLYRAQVDLLILEVDRSEAVRSATIKFAPSYVSVVSSLLNVDVSTLIDNAVNQNIVSTAEVHQYPLAAICRAGQGWDTEEYVITQADITNLVGTSRCPFVTGILQVQSIDAIVAQWESEFETWFASVKHTITDEATLQATVAGLVNGDTPAGDASKLGGEDPSHYASASDVEALKSGVTPAGNASKLGGQAPSYYATAAALSALTAAGVKAGTFAGKVLANATAVATVTDKQMRNIYAGTADMTAGTTALTTGDIYVMYE